MAYAQIEYTPAPYPLDVRAEQLIQAADARFDAFYAAKLNRRYPRYIASDPLQIYAALKWLQSEDLVMGKRFLEWGSGFGLATGLASLLGCESCGIELRQGLVDIARELMEGQSIEADFLCTSYIPEGFVAFDTADGEDLVADDSFRHEIAVPRYEADGLEIEIAEIDLFYVYPWPGEQVLMLNLFDAVASPDALLLAYYGDQDVCIYRKL